MSRDLTCNESLAEDGGNNFSPNQGRFNQTQQLFSNSTNQSLVLLRDQLMQQQQLQSQAHSNQIASLLRTQQGLSVESLGSQLNQANPTSMADNSSLLAQLQLLQQHNQQQQRQAQLSMLTQSSNFYGNVSSSASALNNLGLQSAAGNVDQQSRLNSIQQLASALGLQVPGAQSVQNEYDTLLNQLLHQVQAPQQLQNAQSVIANAQALQQNNLTQAARPSSIEQQLLSRLLGGRNPSVGGTNNAQLLLQQQLAEILQSPQLLQVARELTEQHSSPQSQQTQFQKQELRQTVSYPSQNQQTSDALQQYLQRIAAQCGVTLPESQFAGQQAATQGAQLSSVPASIHQTSLASQIQHLNSHAQQSFVSQANSLLNNLQSAYMLQHDSQTPQQQQQFDQHLTQPNTSRASGTSPRILKRSRPSSSTPGAASVNSLSASQQRLLADCTVEELKQKQSELVKSSMQLDGASTTQQQDLLLEEYRRIQRLIDLKTAQNHERNGSNYQNERSRLNEEQFLQDKLINAGNSYQSQAHLNPSDPRFISNIPTLAAFRQVPGQDIFEHMPKKRLKQEKQVDKNATPLGTQRKQGKSAEAQIQNKKSPQKSAYMSKKFQNGSSNYANQQFSETITLDEDFENFGRQANSSLPRKRGRPRATVHDRQLGFKQGLPIENKDSPTRTILHDAVDIFLKPAPSDSTLDRSTESPVTMPRKRFSRKIRENEQLLSKINSLAVAVSITSPHDSDLLSPDRLSSSEKEVAMSKKDKMKFNIKSAETQQSIKEFRDKHPELGDLTDLEVCGVQSIMESIGSQYSTDPVRAQKNKAILEKFVASSLSGGPNFWNLLHRIPRKMLPNELQIVDHVFNQQHLLDLAKVDMLTEYAANKHASTRSRPLFRDAFDANERKNVQSMAMHLSFALRRMDFVKDFIYESTMVRLMNDEYKQLRGDSYPKELFIDEPSVYNRISKQYGQVPPESSRSLNCAEVECKLLNQMYRYRSQFFNEVHKRPFALTPQKKVTPDQLIIQNMDISKTLFNIVESVSTEKPYVTFEQETQAYLQDIYPTAEDHQRLSFKTGEHVESDRTIFDPNAKQTVILKAKQSTSEVEELKQRLQSHLNSNFNELLKLHDAVYKIRCRAIELHRDDFNHLITSVQRSVSSKSGRRSTSVEPPMLPTDSVPLFNRRRSRSLDIGIRSRVVNSVGVRYVPCPPLNDSGYAELMQSQEKEPTVDESSTESGPKEYHKYWKEDGFSTLAERFAALLQERQHLIAALIKLTLTDQDTRAIIEAACEKNVAVDTPTFKIQAPGSRRHKIKSGISVAHHVRRLPHLHRLQLSRRLRSQRAKAKLPRFKKNDFNWWYSQMLNGNLENAIASANRLPENGHQNPKLEKQRQQRLKERNRFVAMCKRMQSEGLIPYSPSLYTRDKNFTIETLSDRSFNIELNFRHLKCLALKFYACLDPERHAQFVQKLEKIEAPRLDVVLKMRNDLTIGYLYELPAYELRSHAPQRHKGSSTIKVAPGPDSLDHLFGGKTKNPYRQSLLFPVTTSQFEINSAQLTKYRVREQDATPAERLNNNMNLVDCSRALIRLIYQSSKYGNELAIFVNHPAFKILENEQGDSNGLPSTVYQVALTKAIEQKKVPIEKRKMPEFKTDEEAEQYFKERQKAMKEKLASILTTAHKQTVLGRRCIQTMKKLSGVEKAQNAKISVVRQHYNSLSNRSKNQFVKRYRMEKFNEATQFESDIRAEDNLKAPLVIPGFNPPDEKPESSLKLPSYVRNEILSPPKVQLSTADDIRSSIRGGKISRGRGGRRIRRGAKY